MLCVGVLCLVSGGYTEASLTPLLLVAVRVTTLHRSGSGESMISTGWDSYFSRRLLLSQHPYTLQNSSPHSPLSLAMSPSGRCPEGQLAWFDEASNPAVCWIGYPVPAVGFPTTVSLLFALSKYRAFQEQQRQPRESEKYQQHDRDNVSTYYQISRSSGC